MSDDKKEFLDQFEGVKVERYNRKSTLSSTLGESLYLGGSIEKCAFSLLIGGQEVTAYVDFGEAQIFIEGRFKEHRQKLSEIIAEHFELDVLTFDKISNDPAKPTAEKGSVNITNFNLVGSFVVETANQKITIQTLELPATQLGNEVSFQVSGYDDTGESIIISADFSSKTLTGHGSNADPIPANAVQAFQGVFGAFNIDQ